MYGLNRTGPLWIDMASLIVIGFFVYGPIMMIGLHALELVPKKAAGTAAGFTGFFGYAFGSAIAGTGVGWIADHWGWGGVFATMIVCCVMAMAFVSLTLRQRRRLRPECDKCRAARLQPRSSRNASPSSRLTFCVLLNSEAVARAECVGSRPCVT